MTDNEHRNIILANADWNFKNFFEKAYPVGSTSRMKSLNWAIYRALAQRAVANRLTVKSGFAA